MIRDGVMPYKIHNYAHNQEWLIRDLSHVGNATQGLVLARSLLDVPRHPEQNDLKKHDSCAGFGRQRLVEVCVRVPNCGTSF